MRSSLLVDAHEDIAWNALTCTRDYSKSARWLRLQESGSPIPSYNGNTLLGKEDWLNGRVALIFATLFVSPVRKRMGEWDTQSYQDQDEAHRLAAAQSDYYRRLAEQDRTFRLVESRRALEEVLSSWADDASPAERLIGLLQLMEGADPIVEPAQMEMWFERGVRIVGLAWEATRYAGGTHEPGPLSQDGVRLLDRMNAMGMIVDLSHLAEEAYYQVCDNYPGTLIATHANPRRFLPTSRGLSDEMISVLAERGGVVGIVPYNAFLRPGWRKGDPREEVGLTSVADAIDHVCQLTGSVDHVGIGSDFDGGFGVEHVPVEIDTVADLQKIGALLADRGYTQSQIQAVMSGNWLRILRAGLAA